MELPSKYEWFRLLEQVHCLFFSCFSIIILYYKSLNFAVPRLSDLCERLIHKLIISEAAPVHTSRLPDRFRAIFQSKNSEIINAAQAISMSALRPI